MKIVSGVLIALLIAAATALVIQQQAQVKLRQENESLRLQLDQLARLQSDNEHLSKLLTEANASADGQTQELLKLRSEVGTLHQQTGEIADLQKKNQQLNTALASSRNAPPTRTLPTEPVPKINAPDNAAGADIANNGPDLGAIQLVNQTPSQFDLGNGKTCTLIPTIDADGHYDIKALFEVQRADGQTERLGMGEVTVSPGLAVRLNVGDNSIGFIPTVSSAP